MSRLDDLRAAGFSDEEVGHYAASRRQDLIAGGYSPGEADDYLGTLPNSPAATRTFAQSLTDRINRQASAPVVPTASIAETPQLLAGRVEAMMNLGSGLVAGAPAYLVGALKGLSQKYLLGQDVDPAETAKVFQDALTYNPRTQLGDQFSQTLAAPLAKLSEAGEAGGHKVTDVAMKAGASGNVAAGAGAITEATIQTLPALLLGEMVRKMSGTQHITSDDMQNAAKVIAGDGAPAETVAAVDHSLRATYDQTGLGPHTILERAMKDEGLRSELEDPKVGLPPSLEEFVPRDDLAEPPQPAPGDGAPFLESSKDEALAPELPALDPAIRAYIDDDRNVDSTARAYTMLTVDAMREAQGLVAPDVIERIAAERIASRVKSGDWDAAEAAQVEMAARGVVDYFEKHPPTIPEVIDEPGARQEPAGVQLNSGIDPTQILKSFADEYTPYVGVARPEAPVRPAGAPEAPGGGSRGPIADAFLKIFAPAARGPLAEAQAGIMRSHFGHMARESEMALEQLKGVAAQFDKLPVEKNVAFIDAMEKGTAATGKMADQAAALRGLLDGLREQIQGLGKGQLEHFDENYFPHIWQDPESAMGLGARRPLRGSGAFLKARTIPTFKDGISWRAYTPEGDFVASFQSEGEARAAAGTEGRVGAPLKPVTTNPVELALLKASEMRRYLYGQRIFDEMKTAGLARFVGFGDRAPMGWTKINDSIARVLQKNEGEGGGMILRGEYYAPDEAATLINNHLSPGMQGNPVFDAWRKTGMIMNAAQLALSLFHVGFTTLDAMVSRVALGVKQMSRGDFVEGAKNVGVGVTPAQPVLNLIKGDRLLNAYLGNLDDPAMYPLVDALMQAGGRVKMDDFYRNETVNRFKNAIRNGDTLGAATSVLPTILDRANAPVFEKLVPRQKLGVFFDMAKDFMERNPDADVATQRAELGKLWDSVDNRMGELVYDNVFWNRALKDGLMATVRSVGWNLGTFRELGGGTADLLKSGIAGMSDRAAYVLALPFVTAIYGALTNYLYTGEAPRDAKDLFFPRTGRLRPDGSEDRVSLPTYMKDVYAYGEDVTNFAKYGGDPTQTIKNKMNPLVATVSEMLNNEDFFGGAIRNPADPAMQQLAQEAAFLVDQMEPFSLRNYQQQAKEKGEEPSFLGYLTSPSMVGVTPAPGYIVKSPEEKESSAVSRLHDPLVKRFREQIKGGADVDSLVAEMIKSGMSRADIKRIIETSGPTPKPHRLKSFGTEQDEPLAAAPAAPTD